MAVLNFNIVPSVRCWMEREAWLGRKKAHIEVGPWWRSLITWNKGQTPEHGTEDSLPTFLLVPPLCNLCPYHPRSFTEPSVGCAHFHQWSFQMKFKPLSSLQPLLSLLGRDGGISTSVLTQDLVHEALRKRGESGDPGGKYCLSRGGEQLYPSL